MPEPNPITDALKALAVPSASPSLTVLRQATDKAESFTLKHEPLPCPPIPEAPRKLARGRRVPCVHSLTDLKALIETINAPKPIGFYTTDAVSVILDYDSKEQVESVSCDLECHPTFDRWKDICSMGPLPMTMFIDLLRRYRDDITGVEELIGIYSSLTGTLVHSADEYLDQQGRSATFTVKRKARGNTTPAETQVEDVPTEFEITTKILCDDEAATPMNIQVRMTGGEGEGIKFGLSILNIETIERDHIDGRLEEFAGSAGFLCVRGSYQEQAWAEPQLPASVEKLLTLQTKMIAAMSGCEM